MKAFITPSVVLLAAATIAPLHVSEARAAARQTLSYAFDLPSQPLADALRLVGSQSRINVAFDLKDVREITAPALRGEYEPADALKTLLKGTGLILNSTPGGTYIIKRAAAPARVRAIAMVQAPAREVASASNREARAPLANAPESDEIIVTAQRRSENVQRVSAAITVLSNQEMHARRIDQPGDLTNSTPGLVARPSVGSGQTTFTVRGIGLNDFSNNNDPSVSVYLNGVLQAYGSTLGASLFDIQRVEVVKGPQGTLYGRNTTGGAINFIPNKPTDQLEGETHLTIGSFNEVRTENILNVPVTDDLAVRGSMVFRRRDGFQKNFTTHERDGAINSLAGRLLIQWEPSEAVSVLLDLHGNRERSEQQSYKAVGIYEPGTTNLCAAALAGVRVHDGSCVDLVGWFDPDPDPDHVFSNNLLGNYNRNNNWGGSATFDWSLGFATLTSITAYDRGRRREAANGDGSPLVPQFGDPNPLALVNYSFNEKLRTFSQDLRLASSDDDKLSWILGAYYLNTKIIGVQTVRNDGFLGAILHLPLPYPEFGLLSGFDQHTISYAGYASAKWNFTPEVAVRAGLRYTHDKKSYSGGTSAASPLQSPAVLIPFTFIDAKTQSSFVTGDASFEFTPSTSTFLYAKYSRGARSGGFSASVTTTQSQLQPFRNEQVDAWEVGAKLRLFDIARLNLSAFYYDWQDLQATVAVRDPRLDALVTRLINAGDAHIRGIEADLVVRPSQRLELSGMMNILKGKVVSGPLKGQSLPQAPTRQFTASARYTVPISDNLSAFARVDGNYSSNTRAHFDGGGAISTPLAYLGSRYQINLQAGIEADKFQLSAWVRNVTKKRYRIDVFELLPFTTLDMYNQPRTAGLSAFYKF